jgi:hypothetical protein
MGKYFLNLTKQMTRDSRESSANSHRCLKAGHIALNDRLGVVVGNENKWQM